MGERLIPTINESVPELIKTVMNSFREREFNEVQNILIDREKNIKNEMENLVKERDSIKEEARLLEKTQSLFDLEKSKLEEKLQMSRKECEELNKRIDELKNKILESERLVEGYEEKLKCLFQENVDLRHEKLAVKETMEELRQKQFEANQVVEGLKRQILEVTQTLDELRQEKMESDTAAELYKSKYENLEPTIKELESELANMLNVKAEDIANIVETVEKSTAAAVEGQAVDLPDFGNGVKAEDAVVVSPGEGHTTSSIRSGGIGLPKKGGRNLVHSWTKEDGANTVRTSPGSQSGRSPPHIESNGTTQDNEGEEPLLSGARASAMRLDGGVPVKEKSMFGARCSNKIASSSHAAGDVIEICDSDDETKPGDTTYLSNPSSRPTNKRNRTNLITDRRRLIFTSDEEDNFDDLLIATLQSKKRSKT